MTTHLSNAFVTQFATDVHIQYQQMGSQLKGFCRRKDNVTGYKTTFNVAGKGVATKKSRHGVVTPMNADREPVECLLEDWYAPEYVDLLDEEKISHDERMVCVKTCVAALGRKTDETIIAGLDAATITNVVGDGSSGITRNIAIEGAEKLRDTGYRGFAPEVVSIVGNREWSSLMTIEEFVDADKIGQDSLPYKQWLDNRVWMGVLWMWHDLLTVDSGIRYNYMWHKDAVGVATGHEVSTKIDWVPERVAHLVNAMMSMGAKVIDPTGVVEIRTDHDAEIPSS